MDGITAYKESESLIDLALSALQAAEDLSARGDASMSLVWNWAYTAVRHSEALGVENASALLGKRRLPDLDALKQAILAHRPKNNLFVCRDERFPFRLTSKFVRTVIKPVDAVCAVRLAIESNLIFVDASSANDSLYRSVKAWSETTESRLSSVYDWQVVNMVISVSADNEAYTGDRILVVDDFGDAYLVTFCKE